eukprot:286734-Pyramimonas_sp.AAC.1
MLERGAAHVLCLVETWDKERDKADVGSLRELTASGRAVELIDAVPWVALEILGLVALLLVHDPCGIRVDISPCVRMACRSNSVNEEHSQVLVYHAHPAPF